MAYQTISLNQFQAILTDANGWQLVDHHGEYVLDWQIPSMPTGTIIKVYTSIRKRNDLSRFKGEDSIKVCCVYRDNGLVKSVRVYRTPGWQGRLKAAIVDVLNKAKARRQYIQGDKVVWGNPVSNPTPTNSTRTPATAPRRMPRRHGGNFLPSLSMTDFDEYSDEPDIE